MLTTYLPMRHPCSRSLLVSKHLHKKLLKIVNGEDPNVPKNALSEAMQDLQVQLEATVARFRSELNALHQQGTNAIREGAQSQTPSGKAPSEASNAEEPEPVMSILPIDDEKPAPTEDDVLMPERVVLQKSKEQIMDAVRMAGEAGMEERTQRDEL